MHTGSAGCLIWKEGQAFAHYESWECFNQGFYKPKCGHTEVEICQSEALLCSPVRFAEAIDNLISQWPVSAAVHLSNSSINRRAWLGQTACFLIHGACDECTKAAWRRMSETDQWIANEVAEQKIRKWNQYNFDRASCPKQSAQLAFQF